MIGLTISFLVFLVAVFLAGLMIGEEIGLKKAKKIISEKCRQEGQV